MEEVLDLLDSLDLLRPLLEVLDQRRLLDLAAKDNLAVLRGEVEKPALIKDLEKRTKKVQGVREVENLLHVPGSKAPTAS